jgi:hypothetical protein
LVTRNDGFRDEVGAFDHARKNGVSTPPKEFSGQQVKPSWVIRRIPSGTVFDWRPIARPAAGDVLLCEIVKPSLHPRLELRTGARSVLYEGDLVVGAVGSRYATSLLEGIDEIRGDRADLLSASGVFGTALDRVDKKPAPTSLRVIAQAFRGESPLSLRSFGLEGPPSRADLEPSWVLVVGSAMDSGKTTACTTLIHALSRAGLRSGAAKLTGTASARDLCAFRDAGANPVLDFLDCGWESTAGCSPSELKRIARSVAGELGGAALDVAVVEVADGIIQPETRALLADLRAQLSDPTVIFTARESLAAVAGVERLAALGYDVRAVSGVVTSSPLAAREVELDAGVPCIRTSELGRRAIELGWFTGERSDHRAVAVTA